MLPKQTIDYDTQWKMVITVYFEDFIAYFLPDLYKDVDFSYKPEFLDKELHELLSDRLTGKREADQLAKVKLKNGKEEWIFIHIEAQSYHDTSFALRMFTMYYRIWDKYGIDIVAIAVFTTATKMATQYNRQNYGTNLVYHYNSYYVKDQKEEKLLASNNVFAFVVLASQYAMQTKGKTKNKQISRFKFKTKLVKLLLEHGYTKHSISQLFIFVQNILKLPSNLELEFKNEVKKLTVMDTGIYPNQVISQEVKDLFEVMYKSAFGLPDDVDILDPASIHKIEAAAEEKVKQARKATLIAEEKARKAVLIAEEKARKAALLAEEKARKAALIAEEKARKAALIAEEKANNILIKMLYQDANLSIQEIAQKIEKKESYVQAFLKQNNLL
ncbi:MAG: Rpn family recombination-promoting nuclease/putative transposase [Chitinophagales bacterium]